MSILAGPVIVAATATQIVVGPNNGESDVIVKNSGSNTVYLGGVGVTTTTGYPLGAGETLCVVLRNVYDVLYGIVATSTETVNVLETRS